jgi:hypothetical protein
MSEVKAMRKALYSWTNTTKKLIEISLGGRAR